MKIAIIITSSDRAGAQMHVLSLIKGLRSKHHFILITGSKGFLTDEVDKLGIDYHVVETLNRSISLFNDYHSFKSIRSLLKLLNPDLVHVHSAKAAFIGRLASRAVSIKSIYTVHGWAFSKGNGLVKRVITFVLEKMMVKYTNKFIVVSHYDKSIAINWIADSEKLTVVHNGVSDNATFNRLLINEEKKIRLICVARLSKQKNIPCILKTLSMVNSSFCLDVVGAGPSEIKIKRYAAELGLGDKVKFLGERSDIHELLMKSDICVLSSDWEGLPIALIEAARASLPIIATDVGGVSEIVDNGINGYLINRNDAESFASKLNLLAFDKLKYADLSQKSRERYEKFFKIDPMLKKINDIYLNVGN